MTYELYARLTARIARLAGASGIIAGAIVLTGWSLGSQDLMRLLPRQPAIVANAAVAVLSLGVAIRLLITPAVSGPRFVLGGLCAVVSVAIGGVTIAEYLGAGGGIDRLLFADSLAALGFAEAGRPSLLTAINMVALGTSLLLVQATSRLAVRVADLLTVLAIQICLLALIGHACNVPSFYGWRTLFPSMVISLPMSVLFTLLGVGVLSLRPDRGLASVITGSTTGSVVARRLILAPALIPLATGLIAIACKKMGFYNPEFVNWAFAFSNIFVFTGAIWWIAVLLHHADEVRRLTETQLREAKDHLKVRVTERTAELARTNELLRFSEARLQTILENLDEGVMVADLAGRFLMLNRAALDLLGFPTFEEAIRLLPATETLFRFTDPDTRIQVERPLHRVLAGERLQGLEVRVHQCADGWDRVFSFSGTLVQDAAGRPALAVLTLSDVTKRRQTEAQIRELNADLERRVGLRTQELQAKNHELETFSYSVSHDLKAPLRALDGYSRLLIEDHREKLNDEGRQFLDNIRHAASRMQQLIDDLLAYSRLERRALTLNWVDPRAVVDSVLEERKPELDGVEMTVDLVPGRVRADPEGLSAAVRNLVDNALKFSKFRKPPVIEIRSRCELGRYLLTVRDNGTGFDMKYHDRIFQIFQRLHRAEDFAGTGVGLAIVHKAMERMNGRVWAQSVPDCGATFHLDLPGGADGGPHTPEKTPTLVPPHDPPNPAR